MAELVFLIFVIFETWTEVTAKKTSSKTARCTARVFKDSNSCVFAAPRRFGAFRLFSAARRLGAMACSGSDARDRVRPTRIQPPQPARRISHGAPEACGGGADPLRPAPIGGSQGASRCNDMTLRRENREGPTRIMLRSATCAVALTPPAAAPHRPAR